MALNWQQFVTPVGEIEPKIHFPDDQDNVADKIRSYLTEGYGKTSDDDAVAHWVYYRLYWQIYLRMSASPIQSELVDQGNISFDKDQANRFMSLAMRHKDEFESLISEDFDREVFGVTGSVKNKYGF